MGIKNVCIYGVGGVGGFFGGQIADYISKFDADKKVYFVARGAHLDKIKKDGLLLNTSENSTICKPHQATDNIENVPECDLVIVAVKGYDLDSAVKNIKSIIREDTVILPLLNGVDIYERIRNNLDKGIVLPACVYVGTHIEAPGIVTQKGGDGKILFGKDPRLSDFYPASLISFFEELELNFEWNDDPYPAIWSKYMFITAFGLVTAGTDSTLGGIMESEGLKNNVFTIMEEIKSISLKKQIGLDDDIVEKSLNKAFKFPPETKTSFQRDVEKGGKNEGDLFGGTVIRMGETLGIPIPKTKEIYGKISAFSDVKENRRKL